MPGRIAPWKNSRRMWRSSSNGFTIRYGCIPRSPISPIGELHQDTETGRNRCPAVSHHGRTRGACGGVHRTGLQSGTVAFRARLSVRSESFIKTLKQEEIDARPYRTMEELAAHVEEFIERVYNPVRLHSALAYQSDLRASSRH